MQENKEIVQSRREEKIVVHAVCREKGTFEFGALLVIEVCCK